MRYLIVGIAAAVLSLSVSLPCVYEESTEEIICEICTFLDESGKESKVTVTGKRVESDAEYFRDIKISIDDGREIIPETNEGYGAGVSAFDFKGEGYCQLFYYAGSGGSGGFGYYYVFDCSTEKPTTVFDYKKFIKEYRAEYDDGFVNVYSGKELFVTYDARDMAVNRTKEKTYYDTDAYVTDLNFLEPVFVYSLNHYRLNAWQNVIAGAKVNVVGRIITTLTYDNEKKAFIKGFYSVFGKTDSG